MSNQGEYESQLAGRLTGEGHCYHARVYYADTDFSGFVYHARYLEFLERGRSDYLRLLGIHHTALATGDEPLVWVVRRMDIQFLSPARMDDIVTVETVTKELSGARITMAQTMLRGDTCLISAKVEAAIVTLDGKPRRFPKDWKLALTPSATR
ncbi:MAG: tol-pal system-associated acyl-CoA thioesterase [Notoacmeibacter sp.]